MAELVYQKTINVLSRSLVEPLPSEPFHVQVEVPIPVAGQEVGISPNDLDDDLKSERSQQCFASSLIPVRIKVLIGDVTLSVHHQNVPSCFKRNLNKSF